MHNDDMQILMNTHFLMYTEKLISNIGSWNTYRWAIINDIVFWYKNVGKQTFQGTYF